MRLFYSPFLLPQTQTYKPQTPCLSPSQSLPKEIIFAVQSPLSRKTFFCQITFALAALHALDVPGSVQHVEQEAVQNRPLAAGAVDHGFGLSCNPTTEARKRTQINSSTGQAWTDNLLLPSQKNRHVLSCRCKKSQKGKKISPSSDPEEKHTIQPTCNQLQVALK